MEVLSSRILVRPSDLGRSRRFYRDVLGLAVYREFGPPEDPGIVFFLGQGFLEVSGYADGPAGGPVMIWIQVRDVRAEHARLAAAGVTIAITTDHPVVPINLLVTQAVLAVKEGLDRETALRALTINPARIAGIDERLGSLTPGKDADLCVWSGDPLEVNSRVERSFVGGREVYRYDPVSHDGVWIEP